MLFLSSYFLQQNAAIAKGSISGISLNLQVLGVGDGLTDPLSQYPGMPNLLKYMLSFDVELGYLTYASTNRYHSLVPQSTIADANYSWTMPGGCKDQVRSLQI